jgi:hypothetical protein
MSERITAGFANTRWAGWVVGWRGRKMTSTFRYDPLMGESITPGGGYFRVVRGEHP